jgi:glucose/mannose-6-phosphate isomerase
MALDSLGVLDALGSMPEQLTAAHEAAAMAFDDASLPRLDAIDNVVIMGMGGSGVVGDIVSAVSSAALPVPMTVLKRYRTPAFVGPRTLAFAVSYSGDTEETLEMTRHALDAGAHLVAVSSGGALAELAASRGASHFACTAGIPGPRFALGTTLAPVLVALHRIGLFPEAHADLMFAQQQLARRRDQCRPGTSPTNPAKDLARRIGRTIPLIHGAGVLGGVAALRWKQSFNENAKAPAFWNAYPELDHNEICGWGQHGDATRQLLSVVVLRHGREHDRLAPRIRATTSMIDEAVAQIIEVEAVGEGPLAQLLDLVHLGDWVSCYLALDNDVDPGPIDAIAQLKASLAEGAR